MKVNSLSWQLKEKSSAMKHHNDFVTDLYKFVLVTLDENKRPTTHPIRTRSRLPDCSEQHQVPNNHKQYSCAVPLAPPHQIKLLLKCYNILI